MASYCAFFHILNQVWLCWFALFNFTLNPTLLIAVLCWVYMWFTRIYWTIILYHNQFSQIKTFIVELQNNPWTPPIKFPLMLIISHSILYFLHYFHFSPYDGQRVDHIIIYYCILEWKEQFRKIDNTYYFCMQGYWLRELRWVGKQPFLSRKKLQIIFHLIKCVIPSLGLFLFLFFSVVKQ